MHSAPSVSYPVGPSRLADRLLAVAWASGAVCAGSATAGPDGLGGWRALVLGLAVVLAGLAVVQSRRRAAPGLLRFDGRHWSLSPGASSGAGQIQVCLDLQVLMLACIAGPGRPRRWLWLERAADARRWRDLRRAAYSGLPAASDAGGPAGRASHHGQHPASP